MVCSVKSSVFDSSTVSKASVSSNPSEFSVSSVDGTVSISIECSVSPVISVSDGVSALVSSISSPAFSISENNSDIVASSVFSTLFSSCTVKGDIACTCSAGTLPKIIASASITLNFLFHILYSLPFLCTNPTNLLYFIYILYTLTTSPGIFCPCFHSLSYQYFSRQ